MVSETVSVALKHFQDKRKIGGREWSADPAATFLYNGTNLLCQHLFLLQFFLGQHYLFTDYFVAAECGDYEFKTIEI